MKLHFLDRSTYVNQSFSVKHNQFPSFLKLWHYHPELELVYIKKSHGNVFIGDKIESFSDGDLILLGANLPHMWLNDEMYFKEEEGLMAEAMVVHFKREFVGESFLHLPETEVFLDLLEKSERAIKFRNPSPDTVRKVIKLNELHGFEQLVMLLNVFKDLCAHEDKKYIVSEGYTNTTSNHQSQNLQDAYEFIFEKFQEDIKLVDVAERANMNASYFSRFFAKANNKTFSQYLNEIRVGYACKLLLQDNYPIKRICYESGYNNISNFNRQFKKITGLSPSEFRSKRNL